MDSQTYNLAPIGILRSDFTQRFATPRQGALVPSSRAELVLDPRWRGQGVFDGLEGFSHVWLISLLHTAISKNPPGKVHPPRLGGQSLGVFATRSPHRPSPIGLTLARVLEVQADRLVVGEIDLMNDTPILDIKPYVHTADRPQEFQSGWLEQVENSEVPCLFLKSAEEQIRELMKTRTDLSEERFKALVIETIQLDPRPLSYRKFNPGRFACVICEIDVTFEFQDGQFTVVDVRPWSGKNFGPIMPESLRPAHRR